MNKTIPNVDGEYQTKDGKLKVTVTRSNIEIEVDVASGSKVHIIEDEDEQPTQPGKKQGTSLGKKLKGAAETVDGLNALMWGPNH